MVCTCSYEQLEAEQVADDSGSGGSKVAMDGTSGRQCEVDGSTEGCASATEVKLPPQVATTQHTIVHNLVDASQCAILEAVTSSTAFIDRQVFSHPVFTYRTQPTPAIDEISVPFYRQGFELSRHSFQWYYQLADDAVVSANRKAFGDAFRNLLGQSTLQFVYEYTDKPLSRGTLMEGW